MASVLGKKKEKKSEEQFAEERRIGEEVAKEHAAKRKVLVHSGSGIGSGKYGFGPLYKGSGPEGTPTEYTVHKDKRGEYINIDGNYKAYWDDEAKNWRGTLTGGTGTGSARYWSTDVASTPSGGGGGGDSAPQRQSGQVVYPDGQGGILDTNPSAGYDGWQQQMANYYPTTPNQALNPLVDPNQWMHTPNPAYGILNNPGVYVNNPQPIGVLV